MLFIAYLSSILSAVSPLAGCRIMAGAAVSSPNPGFPARFGVEVECWVILHPECTLHSAPWSLERGTWSRERGLWSLEKVRFHFQEVCSGE